MSLTLYSKPGCPACTAAKQLLETRKVEFVVRDISLDESAREYLLEKGHRTLPQIYAGEQLFVEGGYTGLAKLTPEETHQRIDWLMNPNS